MVTHWLKLLGKGAPDPPMVHITLKRTGEVLKKVKAEVSSVLACWHHVVRNILPVQFCTANNVSIMGKILHDRCRDATMIQ